MGASSRQLPLDNLVRSGDAALERLGDVGIKRPRGDLLDKVILAYQVPHAGLGERNLSKADEAAGLVLYSGGRSAHAFLSACPRRLFCFSLPPLCQSLIACNRAKFKMPDCVCVLKNQRRRRSIASNDSEADELPPNGACRTGWPSTLILHSLNRGSFLSLPMLNINCLIRPRVPH